MPREPDARYTHKGIYSAWLTKSKGDGAKAKWFQSSCRRFFTIDFDSQIVFYAHSETDRKISLPIQFRDILGASMISDEDRWGHANSSKGAPLNTRGKQAQGEFPFILQTRERRIRLSADTESAAYSWVDMLNNARRPGLDDEAQSEGVVGPVNTSAFDLESTLIFAKRKSSRSSGGKDSPTSALTSSKASHSTNEGSETNSVSSPTAWSDSEMLSNEARLTPVCVPNATFPTNRSVIANADEARTEERFMAAESTENHPATSSTNYAPSSASNNALGASSDSCLRQMLQASDFGFDEGDESEIEPSALSRDSSMDCITISARPRPGPPREFLGDEGSLSPSDQPSSVEHTVVEAKTEEVDQLESLGREDDDSDCEDRCLLQGRDQRIESDLELIKRHRRQETSCPKGHDRERQQQKICASTIVDEKREAEVDEDKEQAARIAADLGLLRKRGGTHSVAIAAATAAAPLRQRTQVSSDCKSEEKRKRADRVEGESARKEEEKARRKAERRAVKEAAKRTGTQQAKDIACEELIEDRERIAADLALLQQKRPPIALQA